MWFSGWILGVGFILLGVGICLKAIEKRRSGTDLSISEACLATGGTLIYASALVAVCSWIGAPAFGRDNGQYSGSPLKGWFESLSSPGHGPCCSNADGLAVEEPDWRVDSGGYSVRLEGEWVRVEPSAVVTTPNLIGKAYVWPVRGPTGFWIRCFLPGAET